MKTLFILLLLAAPAAAQVVPGPSPIKPGPKPMVAAVVVKSTAAFRDYASFYYSVQTADGLLCVNRTPPTTAFTVYTPTPAEIAKFSLKDGVWHCFRAADGWPTQEKYGDDGKPVPKTEVKADAKAAPKKTKLETRTKTIQVQVCHGSYCTMENREVIETVEVPADDCSCGDNCTCTGGECGSGNCPTAATAKTTQQKSVPTVQYATPVYSYASPCANGQCQPATTGYYRAR